MEKRQVLRNNQGFTLLEILMVLLLIAILAAVGITAFVNYTKETKNASTKANLQILRNGIAAIYGKSQLDCGNTTPYWPCADNIQNNDATFTSTDTGCSYHGVDPGSGTINEYCTTTQLPVQTDREFAQTGIPVNPWGVTLSNAVYDCVANGGTGGTTGPNGTAAGECLAGTEDCQGHAWTGRANVATEIGWCYDPVSGRIWANSANNGYSTSPSTDSFEYSY